MTTTVPRARIYVPRLDVADSELPTLRPGVDELPTTCSACGSELVTVEEPLGLAPYGIATCLACGTVLAHIARRLRPMRLRTTQKRGDQAPPPPKSEDVRPSWRLDGCNERCFGGRHHPLAHEAYGRRQAEVAANARVRGSIVTGPLVVNFDTARVFVDGVDVDITPIEWAITAKLARDLGRMVTIVELLDDIWGYDFATSADPLMAPQPQTHSLRAHIHRLRGRLAVGAPLLRTVPGQGYILVAASPGLGGS
jgi:DNA-binding winged helix-turn-helix (wHTH) protein